MSLTGDEITKGRTYAVTLDRHLSAKRFRDAVSLVKGIDGQHEDCVYDPQNPKAYRTGYVDNEDPARAAAKYDGTAKTWTVTIPAAGGKALSDLRALASAYDAAVDVAEPATPAAAPARPAPSHSAVRNGIDWAEYGDGFSPIDERPHMGS